MPVPETATTSHYSNGVGPGLLQSPLFTRAIAFHELDTLGARASGPHVFTSHRYGHSAEAAPGSALTAVSPLHLTSKRLFAGACGPEVRAPRPSHPEASLLSATFREDHCRLRVGDATENMSTLHGDWGDFAKALLGRR